MGQTIIDEETNIESQTWSAPANFELPTQFEDILTDELTDEKDTELINNQKDIKLIGEKEQSNYVPPTPKEYLATHPLKPGARALESMVKFPVQKSYNWLLDQALQPRGVLGGEQLDPDDYSQEKFPSYYHKEFVKGKDGKLITKEGMEVEGDYDLTTELDPETSTIYETKFVGPIKPNAGTDLFNRVFGTNIDSRKLLSWAGQNGVFGEWGQARTANEDGVWEDYNFMFGDKPLDYDTNLLTVGVPYLLTFYALTRGGKVKADAFNLKKIRSLIKLGTQKKGLKGTELILKGRTFRGLTEGLATSTLINQVYGDPGDTGLGGFASDALISFGDASKIDLRNPITNYLSSENTANDPYHKAKLRNTISNLFIEDPLGGLAPEGIGMGKNKLLTTPALIKSFGKGFNSQLDKFADFAANLIVQQKAVSDLEKAVVLAKDGPTEIKTEVIPTERITGSKNAEPSGKKIEPKATQEELDIQVKEAEVEVVKAEENVEKSVETLGQRDGLIKKALQGELKKVAESDARTLRETNQLLNQASPEEVEVDYEAIKNDPMGFVPQNHEGKIKIPNRLIPTNKKTTGKSLISLEKALELQTKNTDPDEWTSFNTKGDKKPFIPFKLKENVSVKKGRRKIEPGTPHPTDPNKVRSNNGRWVTKAYYDKVNKALAGAEEIKFDQWRENPPEKYKKIGKETDALNQEIIKAYKGESDQDLNVLLKKIDNHMNKLMKEIYDKNPAETDREILEKIVLGFTENRNRIESMTSKKGIFDKDKARIKDLDDAIKKAETTANAQKTIEQIEAEVEAQVNSMTDAEIKESLRQNPKYKDLIDDIDEVFKNIDEIFANMNQRFENIDKIIRGTDEYLDGLDQQIFDPKTTVEDRIKLEKLYQGADATRQDLKLQKKYQAEHLTNEIGTKPETVKSPLTERPFFDFDIKGAKTSYRQMTVEFESDIDRAIYIVTKRQKGSGPAKSRPLYIEQSNKDASRANHKYLAFLYENGLDDKDILKHAPKIYNKMADNYNEFGTYSLKDSGAWKDGSDFDFEIDESEFYNPERKLGDIIKDVDDKLTDEYKARTSPKDPGDAFDPNNFIDDEIIFEAPKLPILPKKGIKGKAYEPILKSRTNAILNRALEEGISPAGWNNILNDIERIAGIKIQMAGSDSNFILRPKASRGPISARAAANYGIEPGTIVTRRGGYNPKKDLIIMSMMVDGEYLEFSRGLQTAWHESFHRLQYKFLSKAEKEMLKKAAPKLREIVKDGFPEVSDAFINKLKDHELQAWAFGAWSNKDIRSKYGRDTTWSQPFKKIREILESVIAVVRSEHKTWDSLFEGARKGEIAQRQALEVQANARRMSYEINPDELVSGMGKYQKGIENGDITLDTAMESETRRLISRSGKTDFVSRDNTSLIAMNATMEDALRGAFGSREEITNMPAYQLREVWNKASKQVEADGYDPAKTIELYEHARKGDIQAMDDIFAAAGILYHRDLNLKLMTEAAVGFNGADTDKGAALFGKKLLARMEDQIKLDIAWTSVTRKTGQILRLAATPHEDVLASSLASNVELKTTISKEAATAATSGGFAPQQGLIGEGVYFSTSSTPGPIGSVELYGTTPEDILILDLVSTNKRITDLINEIGLGVTKKTKEGIQLTPQQQAGIKTWAEEKGYGGIRYGTDFTLNPKTGDQVVVFDVNTANRMIDSDAAVPPPKKQAPPIRTLLQTALQKTEEVLGKKLPRKVRKSIESGDLTPEAKKILDTLAAITYSIKDHAGAKRAMSDLIERVPDGKLDSSTLANLYRNAIFFRMRTWMKVLFGSGYRAATLPITQLVGEFGDQLNMTDAQIKLSQRRQHLNLMIYPQYVRNIPYALKMMVASMKHNEVFVNLGRRKYENLSTRNFKERQEQLEFDFEAKTRLTEQPPEGHFALDEHANPIAHGLWQVSKTFSGRAMAGFDTLVAGVTGPSTEWARIMEMELFNADVKGFEPGSSKAWDWAANRTDEILKSHFQDVDLANGDIIKNGRLTGRHAKKAMDWVNFTDSVKVKQEEMSYEYAVRQAREEGITDSLKIVERADYLMKQELDQGSQFRQAVQDSINAIPEAVSNAHGSKNPFISNTLGIAIPIMRTPANLTKSVLRTLPGVNRVVDSFYRDIHSEDPFTKHRALGETGVAYMTLAFGVMIVNSGYVEVTGPPPLNTARRKELADKGWQAWSVRFKNPWTGDTEQEWSPYYSIEMFDQLSTVLGAVGAYTENYKGLREEDRESLFGAGVIALAQTAKEIGIGQLIKGPTKSLTDLMDLITELGSTERTKAGSRHPFEYYLTNKLAGFFPGFMDESRNAVDPYVKRINPSKLPVPLNVVDNVARTIAAKSAGLSQFIPNRLHPVTGDPIVSYQTPGNQGIDKDMPWLKILNANQPWGVTKTRSLSTDPVDEEMLRIKGRGGTFQIWNRRAFGLPNRVLDQNELNRLIEIGTKEIKIDGLTMHQALKDKLTSPTYQSLDYESVSSSISTSRGIALMKVIRPYVDKAKDAFIIEYDTGVNSLGWEIKNFKSESEKRQYEAEYGKQSSIQDWKQLAQA